MQLLGNLFEYVLARRERDAQHPRRDLGRHRQRRRVRDARQARRRRVHAVAARPHEPVPAGADVRLQDAEHPQHRDRRRVRRLPGHRQGGLRRRRVQAPPPHRHRQLDQLGARRGAGRVLLQRLLRGDARATASRSSFAVPSGNFGNIFAGHVARMMGLPIRRLVARDERERRARRVLPHRPLPRCAARPRRTRRRARRWTSRKASNFERFVFDLVGRDAGARARAVAARSSATAGSTSRRTPLWSRVRASPASSPGAARTPTAWRRSATSHARYGDRRSIRTPPTASRSAREHREPRRAADRAWRPRCRRSSPRPFARRSAASRRDRRAFADLESLPQRCTVLPADAARVKAFIAARADIAG